MLFHWLREHRRRRLLEQPFPAPWREYLEQNVRHYARLGEAEQARLRENLRIFIAEKYWEGCGGLQVTPEMQVTIAAQACLLVLGLEHNSYPQLVSILVYPTAYLVPQSRTGPDGVVRERNDQRLGEAWYRGPVVLAWDDVLAGGRREMPGHNLVFHEFAHQLDMQDREVNGIPPLRDPAEFRQWQAVMTAEYRKLQRAWRRGEPTLLDQYGATSPAEFFAVATECFFEQPTELKQQQPQLYETLRMYYRQDPDTWEFRP